MKVCLDFDGVLHDASNPVPGRRMGPPMSGALDAVLWLWHEQHQLVICTANNVSPDPSKNHIKAWLRYYQFPEIPVVREKPMADCYIDDKALRFDNWGQALFALKRWSAYPRGTVSHGRTYPQAAVFEQADSRGVNVHGYDPSLGGTPDPRSD
jgi:hypothetical protein